MVERAGLENRCRCKPTVGSNPTSSAFFSEFGDLPLPDPDDRHVLAAAIRANADIIITFNVKDVPGSVSAGYKIEAQHRDEFLLSLFHAAPSPGCAAVKRQREGLRNPPKSAEE